MFQNDYYVYLIANDKKGTIYIGVTNDLERRVLEHKESINKGFSSKYKTNKLVYYESYNDIAEAIEREKQLKKWNRRWKLDLIERDNPNWEDLYYSL